MNCAFLLNPRISSCFVIVVEGKTGHRKWRNETGKEVCSACQKYKTLLAFFILKIRNV